MELITFLQSPADGASSTNNKQQMKWQVIPRPGLPENLADVSVPVRA